jgi:hypothetical protein
LKKRAAHSQTSRRTDSMGSSAESDSRDMGNSTRSTRAECHRLPRPRQHPGPATYTAPSCTDDTSTQGDPSPGASTCPNRTGFDRRSVLPHHPDPFPILRCHLVHSENNGPFRGRCMTTLKPSDDNQKRCWYFMYTKRPISKPP